MSNVTSLDPVLTTEAARILEVAPETVRHWERIGLLPALKTERGVRLFDRRDVERLAAERSQRRAIPPVPTPTGAAA